ncbi:MAG: LysR substrate-binding domain-containing protein, partial [Lacisediminimonas sp.]|nr:LysR substrate-binding domain-containing protein [Lacisediminimonas sp.]
PSVSEALVGRLFNQVQQQFPAIQLRIHDAYSGDINEWLASGKIDIGISNIYRTGGRLDNPLFESKLLLVAPAGDPLATWSSLKFESVVRLPLVLPIRPNALRGALDDAAKQIGMSIKPHLEVSSSVALKSAIIHSGLYSVMPLHLIIQEVKRGIVVAVPITNPTLPQTLFLSTNKSHALSVAARAILRMLPTVVKDALKAHLA